MSGPRTVSGAVVFAQPIPAGAARSGCSWRTRRAPTRRPPWSRNRSSRSPARSRRASGSPSALTVPEVDEHARYDVRVHVDRSGSGEVSPGDRITTRAYPVLTQGAGDHVEVEVVDI